MDLIYKGIGYFTLICIGVFLGAILQSSYQEHQKFEHDQQIALTMMKNEVAREHKDIWSTLSPEQKDNLRKWQQQQLDAVSKP